MRFSIQLAKTALVIAALAAPVDSARGEASKVDGESEKVCLSSNVKCANNCRNGTTIPIGSKPSAINSCDNKCDAKLARCMKTSMSRVKELPQIEEDGGDGAAVEDTAQ
jgi:hypothetical protein